MINRKDELNLLYNSSVSKGEFDFDMLQCRYNIYQLLSPTDIGDIHYIATNIKFKGNVRKRKLYMDDIMRKRNFMKVTAGTNRLVYKFLDDQSFVCKLPIDKNGIFDNISEATNQLYLKPFNAKMFQVSDCGTISCSECVRPIRYAEEFESVADDVFDLLYKKILGKYVMDDIGASKFMNYGIRKGFGPVFLDFPRIFVLDGGKLKCQNIVDGFKCGGEIDYDLTFDNLICKCCGKRYRARDLMDENIKTTIIYEKGVDDMRLKMFNANGELLVNNTKEEITSDIITPKEDYMRVKINRGITGEPKFTMEDNLPDIGLDIIRGQGEESNMRVSFGNVNIDNEISKIESDINKIEASNNVAEYSIVDLIKDISELEKDIKEDLVEEIKTPIDVEEENIMDIVTEIRYESTREDEYETVYTESDLTNTPIADSLKKAVVEKEKKQAVEKNKKKKGKVIVNNVGTIVEETEQKVRLI